MSKLTVCPSLFLLRRYYKIDRGISIAIDARWMRDFAQLILLRQRQLRPSVRPTLRGKITNAKVLNHELLGLQRVPVRPSCGTRHATRGTATIEIFGGMNFSTHL